MQMTSANNLHFFIIFINVKLLFILLFLLPLNVFAITLNEAVNIYALQAPSVKVLRLRLLNSHLEFENYKKEFLPAISFNLNPINFNRSFRLLQDPITGDYSYVNDYSSSSSTDISISQKIGPTGGYLSFSSSLSYLREFSSYRNTFNSSPLYVSYSQPFLREYKLYKYNKAIIHLKHNISIKDFCKSMSQEQEKVLSLYLNAFLSKLQYDVTKQNLLTGDTLLRFAKKKLENGIITRYEYNQIELHLLQTEQKVTNQDRIYNDNIVNLCTELGVSNIEIEQPEGKDLPLHIDYSNVLTLVYMNNPHYLSTELQRKQAEYNRQKMLNDLKFNGKISLSYGLNQYGSTLKEVYSHPVQRQSVSITFSFPVFQWGINRNKRKIADNEFLASIVDIERDEKEFENSIRRQVEGYNSTYKSFFISRKAFELSNEQYRQAVMKFGAGKISVYEVTQVFESLQAALINYSSTMRDLYREYFDIRHLTLYDFVENINLEDLYTKR